MEIISHMPMKNAKVNAEMASREKPKIVGPTPAACIIAELKIMALTTIAKAMRLLERSISFVNSGRLT